MKLAERIGTVEGNAVFEETVKMTVENKSIGHIIRSLTDMYSNPVLALSREYISNAYDACIAKMGTDSAFGTQLDTPIEVTLPTALTPNFVVRDYGTGMSRDVLANVFPRYGASTKRDNNSEIGGFGLGAKSALAVVANFTVVSVKDGKKNIGIVQKGADGVGEISFLPEQDTDEPSGTTVTVALPDPAALNRIFRDSSLLLGFPHGSITVNGKLHENSVYNPDLYMKLGEEGWMSKDVLTVTLFSNGRCYDVSPAIRVVVGPISYTVSPNDLFPEGVDSWGSFLSPAVGGVFTGLANLLVVNLPIGSVDFTPARDSLIYSERTRETIIEAARKLNSKVQDFLQQGLADCTDKREALIRAERLRRIVGYKFDLTYDGSPVPENSAAVLFPDGAEGWFSSQDKFKSEVSTTEYVRYWRTQSVLAVTGVKDAAHATALNKLRKYYTAKLNIEGVNNSDFTVFYVTKKAEELSEWAEHIMDKMFTAEEWEATGVAFQKEISAERRAERESAEASITTPLPVTNVFPSDYDLSQRPSTVKVMAQDIAKAKNVVYIHAPRGCKNAISRRYAEATTNVTTAHTKEVNGALSAIINFYSTPWSPGVDAEKVNVVRVPANTSIKTFLAIAPHAISIEKALEGLPEKMQEALTDPLTVLMSQERNPFRWTTVFNDPKRKDALSLIENVEVRAFVKECAGRYDPEAHRKPTKVAKAARVLFVDELSEVFAGVLAKIEPANKFPLPLLNNMGYDGKVTAEDSAQYINLMYPAAK